MRSLFFYTCYYYPLTLYLNFWVILILFVAILGPLMGKGDLYPGTLVTFLLTATAISPAYNGAWWFLTTYILLILLSRYINELVRKHNPWLLLGLSFIIYLIAYIQRIKTPLIFDSLFINWVVRQLALWGTSQLPFIVGGIFAYYNLYSKLWNQVRSFKTKNYFCALILIILIMVHGVIQTLFIAVFTGIVFICIFNLMDKPHWLEQTFILLGEHSTNIWLTHMFFYMTYFKDFIYSPQNPILIFSLLMLVSLGSSYVIQFIFNRVWRFSYVKLDEAKKLLLNE